MRQTDAPQAAAAPAKRQLGGQALWQLFISMFRLGLFTFGGGYVIVPLMQREFVEKYHWIDDKEMVDIVAISQSLPGAIAVNASVFIGYRLGGAWGTVVAVLGTALPPLIVLSVITLFYEAFAANVYVQAAFRGIRAGVIALMIQAVWKLGKPALKDHLAWILFSAALCVALFTSVQVVFVILCGGLIGLVYDVVRRRWGRK